MDYPLIAGSPPVGLVVLHRPVVLVRQNGKMALESFRKLLASNPVSNSRVLNGKISKTGEIMANTRAENTGPSSALPPTIATTLLEMVRNLRAYGVSEWFIRGSVVNTCWKLCGKDELYDVMAAVLDAPATPEPTK